MLLVCCCGWGESSASLTVSASGEGTVAGDVLGLGEVEEVVVEDRAACCCRGGVGGLLRCMVWGLGGAWSCCGVLAKGGEWLPSAWLLVLSLWSGPKLPSSPLWVSFSVGSAWSVCSPFLVAILGRFGGGCRFWLSIFTISSCPPCCSGLFAERVCSSLAVEFGTDVSTHLTVSLLEAGNLSVKFVVALFM